MGLYNLWLCLRLRHLFWCLCLSPHLLHHSSWLLPPRSSAGGWVQEQHAQNSADASEGRREEEKWALQVGRCHFPPSWFREEVLAVVQRHCRQFRCLNRQWRQTSTRPRAPHPNVNEVYLFTHFTAHPWNWLWTIHTQRPGAGLGLARPASA